MIKIIFFPIIIPLSLILFHNSILVASFLRDLRIVIGLVKIFIDIVVVLPAGAP